MKKKKIDIAPDPNKKILPYVSLIILTTVIVYFPAFKNGLLNWDDNLYVTNNDLIKSLSNSAGIFNKFCLGNYHPLTIFTYSILYHFSRLSPFLYHFVNIVFHVFNSLLVFYFIKELLKNINLALIVVLLFSLHPMHVESVAWVSELKDVQYTFFFFISLIYYLKFVRKGKSLSYILSLFFFVLSLLSKGQAVSLLPVLLLIDYFERGKFFIRLKEKLPFFILSIAFGIIAVIAQRSEHAISDYSNISPLAQIAIACHGFIMYIVKIIIPFNLSGFYPYPVLTDGKIPMEYWGSLFVIPLTIYLMIIFFKKDKIIFFGLLFFIVNIFLLLQLIPVGNCIMADRYSYIPSVGLNILMAYLFFNYFDSMKQKFLLTSLLTIYLIFLSAYTFNQTKKWKNDFTLWDNVLSIYPDVPSALILRGFAYNEKGEYNKALIDLNRSISINGKDGLAYLNRGVSRSKLGDFKNAIDDFKSADKFHVEQRHLEDLYLSWGGAYANLGNLAEAMKLFNKAIEVNPTNAAIYNNRGITNAMIGNMDEALNDFNYALKLKPDFKDALENRDRILVSKKQTPITK